jgi:phospholipid/cholesterol/gamma-HCH transport system substrate-binding protein
MRTIEISVGAFVLAGILAMVFLAFRVSGYGFTDRGDIYQLKARFDDVAGLRLRSKVSMAGVTIGRISGIAVDKELGEAIVTMDIRSDIDNLSVDTGARIQTEGFIGGRYISLTPGGEEDVLHDGDTITNTQGALVLENLIGELVTKAGGK